MTSEIPGRPGRLLLAALLAGLVPAWTAETGPVEARPRVEIGAEVWRLRPSEAPVPADAAPIRNPRLRPVTEIPESRRTVRMVYPALTEAR